MQFIVIPTTNTNADRQTETHTNYQGAIKNNTSEPEKTSFQLNDNFEPSSGGNMVVGYLLTLTSILLTVLTFPLSLLFVIKVL